MSIGLIYYYYKGSNKYFFYVVLPWKQAKKAKKGRKMPKRRIFGQYSTNPMGEVGFQDLGGGLNRF